MSRREEGWLGQGDHNGPSQPSAVGNGGGERRWQISGLIRDWEQPKPSHTQERKRQEKIRQRTQANSPTSKSVQCQRHQNLACVFGDAATKSSGRRIGRRIGVRMITARELPRRSGFALKFCASKASPHYRSQVASTCEYEPNTE